ncbi:ATP-binding cassette domain-containing protein [Halobacteriovorax marinus]|uniref:ATP-binding cassette domain-containing protein n=1 Tax=Halobacteriovorax marinus TaxID=97084 RepID=UPI003A91EC18
MIEGNIRKIYSGFEFCSGDFKISKDSITIVYGDSGSGKTTFLNCIAGVEKDFDGEVRFEGDFSIGYVFQKNSLFPHLNVLKNLEFAVKRCKEIKYSLDEIVKALEIESLLHKKIHKLSGGEVQRVSIARSILSAVDILLMDEPLSALHTKAKKEILDLILKINREFKIPILMVTHSMEELGALCDEVIYMQRGEPLQVMNREEALRNLDPRGPINILRKEDVHSLKLNFIDKSTSDYLIHSNHIILSSDSTLKSNFAHSINCKIAEITESDENIYLVKLEYLTSRPLYAKVLKNNFDFSIGQEVVALFGPESLMD